MERENDQLKEDNRKLKKVKNKKRIYLEFNR
jgi:hypothetical protein